MNKKLQFPTYNVFLGEAVPIVKYHLDDDSSIPIPRKMFAILSRSLKKVGKELGSDE